MAKSAAPHPEASMRPYCWSSPSSVVDVEHQFRHLVVPIELRHSFRRKSATAGDIAQGRDGRRQLIDIVDDGLEQLRRWDDPFGDALGKPCNRRVFAMDEEQATLDRSARRYPACQCCGVGMAGIVVNAADTGADLDFVAHDPHGRGAVLQEAAQRAVGL